MTEQPNAIALPSRIGQGTAVEQSRAVAEVQSAIVVAQQCPRNIAAAIAQMEQSCGQKMLAERAFYRFNRGGESGNVTGATVHLARELARCWGNVQYGLVEMRRDDDYAQSELQAWAWDVQTNTRVSTTFIVPHKRFTKKGVTVLTDMRDIYESNANNGARRVREMVFSILPPWFVEQAKELCNATLRHGGGIPLPQRIAQAIKDYESKGVRLDQLEAKLDRPSREWTDHDVAQLHIIYTSISNGETTVKEEFPPARVTTAEIVGSTPPAPRPMNQGPGREFTGHADHPEDEYDPGYAGCQAESAAMDQEAAQ